MEPDMRPSEIICEAILSAWKRKYRNGLHSS